MTSYVMWVCSEIKKIKLSCGASDAMNNGNDVYKWWTIKWQQRAPQRLPFGGETSWGLGPSRGQVDTVAQFLEKKAISTICELKHCQWIFSDVNVTSCTGLQEMAGNRFRLDTFAEASKQVGNHGNQESHREEVRWRWVYSICQQVYTDIHLFRIVSNSWRAYTTLNYSEMALE